MQNKALIIVLGVLGALLIAAVVAILIFYDGDKLIAIGGLATVIGLVLPGLLGLKQSADNATAIAENTVTTKETKVAVDGRMDELLRTVQRLEAAKGQIAATSAHADGMAEGRQQVIAEVAAGPAQTPEHLGDGTVVVTAPVSISVKAPPIEPAS